MAVANPSPPELCEEGAGLPSPPNQASDRAFAGLGLAPLAAALAGCGGGDPEPTLVAESEATVRIQSVSPQQSDASTAAAPALLSRAQAARFLAQAGLGATATEVSRLCAMGYEAWLSEQFSTPVGASYVSLIGPRGADADRNNENPNSGGSVAVQRALWRRAITAPDVLRQRVVLALSEIFVVSIGATAVSNKGFAIAAYMDILERQAFGNLRDLLMQVSTSAAMGTYLSFQGNRKANPVTGSQPDENYARELMQLFTIGLVKLNPDGTPVLQGGAPVETYTQADVAGLARVFTGWVLNADRAPETDRVTQPMQQDARWHETGAKAFLGTTIAAGTSGEVSLGLAIDALMAHPNVGPFIARQLIQRLVKSHPSPAYVARVAAAFNGKGRRAKGNMLNTLRAVLLDQEARSEAGLTDPQHGKLREPMLRFIQWARLTRLAASSLGRYDIGDLSSASDDLGQSPLRSPSVFNFFRPGHVPPEGELGRLGLTAPEFQITNETSVAGYLNFMQRVMTAGVGGCKPDYTELQSLAGNSTGLLDELNLLLAAGQIPARRLAPLAAALDTINIRTDAGKLRRVQAAVLMVMAAPEYLVQK